MKTKHKYCEEIEAVLIQMDADEFIEWLKTNEIEYSMSLLDCILDDKIKELES